MPCVSSEVGEDLADGDRVEEEGEDPHLAAALLTDQRVHFVHSTDQLSPRPASLAPLGGIRLVIACSHCRLCLCVINGAPRDYFDRLRAASAPS